MKTVKLTESDLSRIVSKVLNEQDAELANYMFFSNLKQIKRQAEMMLEMDPTKLNDIIMNGHDWADDHISEAKTNIDQVFDFMMNTIKGGDNMEDEDVKADVNQFSMNEEKQIDETKNKPTNPIWFRNIK